MANWLYKINIGQHLSKPSGANLSEDSPVPGDILDGIIEEVKKAPQIGRAHV